MVRSRPWYAKYEELTERVQDLKKAYTERCKLLATDPVTVGKEIWEDLVVRAVHESNWQEGIYLDHGKTRELALHVFGELSGIQGPHLDLDGLVESHRENVLQMKKRSATVDELAAYNLSAAHIAINWIGTDLATRQAAAMARVLKDLARSLAGC